MNSKTLVAFLAGAVLASGIVYMAVRPESPAPAKRPVKAAEPITVESTEVASAPQRAAAEPESEAPPPPAPPQPERKKVREKPSPVARMIPPTTPPASASPPPAPTEAPKTEAKVETQPSEPAPAAPPPPVLEPRNEPAPPQANSVTLKAGTVLQVRVGETISTAKSQPGDSFLMTLAEPLVIDGFVIAERGARAQGRIVEAERAGKVKGTSHLSIELTKFTTSDGQNIRVRTAPYSKDGNKSLGKDAAKVGIGAALGAVIGGIAGGGKGAGIGAGVGGAAGAGDVLLTRGPDASIPVETRLIFKVQENITITEKQ